MLIYNSTITGNSATNGSLEQYGGGIFFTNFESSESITLDSTIVSSNIAGDDGADIFGDSGQVIDPFGLIGDMNGFSFNAGQSPNHQNGMDAKLDSALKSNGGLTKTIAILSGNSCGKVDGFPGEGGAVGTNGASALSFTRCTISNNTAVSDPLSGLGFANGGGIYVFPGGTLTMADSTVSGNKADYGAGIFLNTSQAVTVANCTINNNTAVAGSGGGIHFATGGSPQIINCTIASNQAVQGGGIAFTGSTSGTDNPKIYNSTIANNIANGDVNESTRAKGGGILLTSFAAPDSLLVDSTIVGDNAALDLPSLPGEGPDISGGSVLAFASLIANTNGFTLAPNSISPQNGKPTGLDSNGLKLNGGRTETIKLVAGSNAINAGRNTLNLLYDQRQMSATEKGYLRVTGKFADIGAFETSHIASVAKLEINDGLTDPIQLPVDSRSRVLNVAVYFESTVTLPADITSAFQLKRQSDNALPPLIATSKITATGETVVTFSFPASGTAIDFFSLADGRYTLTAFADELEFSNLGFDGNGDGTAGDNYVLVGSPATAPKLFRFFGDYDGDGAVSNNDFTAFMQYYGGSGTVFDYENDNAVAYSDYTQFRQRFGGSI